MRFQNQGCLRACVGFLLSISVAAAAEGNPPSNFGDARSALGRTNGVSYDLGPIIPAPEASATPAVGAVDEQAGFFAALNAVLFGKDRSVLEAKASVTNLLEGETDFYWGGFRVWSTKPAFKDGSYQVSAGLPTVSMRAPILGVPIGPITLRVDAGVNAEAEVNLKLIPLISIPIQFTSIRGELGPKVSASGFLEGYAKWLILRGGIGGELELVRANAKVVGQVGFSGAPPSFSFDGYINLLAGKIYAFVDYFNIFGWKWKRAIQPILAEWKGKCIDLHPAGSYPGEDPCANVP